MTHVPQQDEHAALALQETPAYKFYAQHAGIPDGLRVKAQPQLTTRIGNWFFNTLLPALRLRWVKVDGLEHEGKIYYHFKVGVPGRGHEWVLTPLGVYFVGKMLFYVERSGAKAPEVGMVGDSAMGDVFVPMWAIPKLLDVMSTILQEHTTEVKFLMGEFDRLSKATAPADELPSPESDEPVPTPHTLH